MKTLISPLAIVILCLLSSCTSSGGNNRNIASNTSAGPTLSPTASPISSPTPESAASPTPSLSPLPPDADGVRAAIAVVHEYYDAINARNYHKAYELWSGKGEASKQTFEEFRDGYANTASVEVDTSGEPGDLEGAAGSQYVNIPLRLKAKTKDGKVQNFWGEYVLRRSMVDGATAEQRAWRFYSAQFKEL